MTDLSQEIFQHFQVRKSSAEKRAFRALLRERFQAAGYTVSEERGALSGSNLILGDPEGAKVLLTAHYDTQAVLPFPNFITPRNLWLYLLYNLVICLGFFLLASLAGGIALSLPLPWYVQPWLPMGLCLFCLWWLFFGKANRHTANDNTSGVLTLVETALSLPPALREGVCFVFFDNEERGMLGSAHFASKHKVLKKDALVLNFDCVSDGDFLQFFPTKRLKKEGETLGALEAAFRAAGAACPGKEVEVVRGFGFYPSDNASFHRACGVCALKKSPRWGYYMDRIHTGRDTVLDEANLALLAQGCAGFLSGLRDGAEA